jgi:hypothetical protein
MLAALPAHRLTHLELGLHYSHSCDATDAELTVALARLSSLQQLCIVKGHGGSLTFPEIHNTYLNDGAAMFPKLTSLALSWCVQSSDGNKEPIEQLLAQPLPQLQQLLLDSSEELELNLSHFTRLQEAGAEQRPSIRAGSVLPTQLKRLQLSAADGGRLLSSVLPLQQLQQLRLHVSFPEPQPLLRLAQLPALQHLALHYENPCIAASAAAAWPLLPQLQELDVSNGGSYAEHTFPLPQQMSSLLGAMTACSALTKLHLGCSVGDYVEYAGDFRVVSVHMEVCARLASMTSLQELQLKNMALVPGDAAALTALTAMTKLSVTNTCQWEGVDTAAACVLASCLTQLRSLELEEIKANFHRPELLAALGQLQQLTELRICSKTLTKHALMQLTGLTNLKTVSTYSRLPVSIYGYNPLCKQGLSNEVLRAFWSAVRQQQQQQQQQQV